MITEKDILGYCDELNEAGFNELDHNKISHIWWENFIVDKMHREAQNIEIPKRETREAGFARIIDEVIL